MCQPLFFLGLCSRAHVAFTEFSHFAFRKKSHGKEFSPWTTLANLYVE